MTILEFTLPGEVISKKNSKKIIRIKGYPRIAASDAFRRYEKACLEHLKYQKPVKWLGEYPVLMTCHFYRKTKRKFDFSNMIESVQDILVQAKVLIDDDYLHIYPGIPSVSFDKEHPRVFIQIQKIER